MWLCNGPVGQWQLSIAASVIIAIRQWPFWARYFPKGTNFSVDSNERLDEVARQLNGRPRNTNSVGSTNMARGFVAGVVVTILVALIAVYAALQSGLIPANADSKPGGLELWVAGTSLNASLRNQAPKQANPVPLTSANLIDGITLYGQHCAICHGTAAGDASASPVAKGLYPAPPQLGSDGVEDDPEGVSFWKIKHGIRLTGMPSWGSTLNDRQIWTLALFLKHMDKLPPDAQRAWTEVKNDH